MDIFCKKQRRFKQIFVLHSQIISSLIAKVIYFGRSMLLSNLYRLPHKTDSFHRIISNSSFSRKHHTVCSHLHRLIDIMNLNSRRKGLFDHTLNHLRRYNNRLPIVMTTINNLLLIDREHRNRYLYTKISSCNHHPIACFDDFLKMIQSLLIFYFCYNAHVRGIVQLEKCS